MITNESALTSISGKAIAQVSKSTPFKWENMHLVILFEFLVNIYGQNVQNQTTKQTAQNKPKSIMKPK